MGGRGHCLQAKERQALGKSAYAGRCSIRLSMATLSAVMHSALPELGRNLSCRSFRVVYVSLLEPVLSFDSVSLCLPRWHWQGGQWSLHGAERASVYR